MLIKKNNNNNEICETADSIYWTLVPKESNIWNTPYTVKQRGMNDNTLYDFMNLWE